MNDVNEKVKAKYSCKKCGAEFPSEQEAEKCFDAHYCVGNVIGVYYDQHKKCPVKIQVEISLGNDDDYQKDVMFELVESGWGRN